METRKLEAILDTNMDISKVIVKPITGDFWEHSYGLFTNKEFSKGDLIIPLKGTIVSDATRTSIRIGKGRHIESYEGGKINHHCNPNTEIRIHKSVNIVQVYAVRDIDYGEEITFNYETTETIMSCPFKCECHGNWIRGNQYESMLMVDEGGMDYSGAFESDIKE